ncbi:MAG: hypothetical protein ACE5J3_09990, partial [Methanosarcinales archaeon]
KGSNVKAKYLVLNPSAFYGKTVCFSELVYDVVYNSNTTTLYFKTSKGTLKVLLNGKIEINKLELIAVMGSLNKDYFTAEKLHVIKYRKLRYGLYAIAFLIVIYLAKKKV